MLPIVWLAAIAGTTILGGLAILKPTNVQYTSQSTSTTNQNIIDAVGSPNTSLNGTNTADVRADQKPEQTSGTDLTTIAIAGIVGIVIFYWIMGDTK